ncbi:MAG: hypothetical protein C4291_03255 [Candidatus Dadabacteria bacterium]
MAIKRIESADSSTYIELIKERGPLTIWEMSVIAETDIFRVQEKLDPLIKEGKIVSFEEGGRIYYGIAGEENGQKKNRLFFLSLFNRRIEFESIPKRTAMKEILASRNNYKKLIQEAYVLTLPHSNPYTEEERIKINLWVERDLKKLQTLDEKKLFLADFIYEKSIGKKKDYFKRRKLLGES